MAGRATRPAVLLPVVVFGLLGACMGVASSVVAVLTPDGGQHSARTSTRYDVADDLTIYVFTVERPGYSLMSVTGPMPTWAADALDKNRSQPIPIGDGDPRPRWLRAADAQDPQTARGIKAGWPFRGLWGRTVYNVNHRPNRTHTGLAHVTVRNAQHAFPWRPLWPGFIANMLVYCGVMLAVWYAAVYAVRWRRGRRGKCPHCAYPVQSGSSLCPECGYAFAPASTGSSTGSTASSVSSAQTTSTLTSKSSSSDDK